MKGKLIFCPIVIVLFIAGHSRVVRAQDSKNEISNFTPYCQLLSSANPAEKNVRTTAVLFIPAKGEPRVDGGSDEYFYSRSCNNRDYFARADLSQANNVNLITKISEQPLAKDSPILLMVTFTGNVTVSFVPTFGHLAWLRAEVEVENVESAKPIKVKYPLPDHESDAPILEAGNSLRDVNAELMTSLFRQEFTKSELNAFFRTDTEISLDGQPTKLTAIRLLRLARHDDTFRVRIDNVAKIRDIWSIRGSLTIITSDNVTNTILFENRYRLHADNSWMLVSLRLNRSAAS